MGEIPLCSLNAGLVASETRSEKMVVKLFVGNLPDETDKRCVTRLFEEFGEVSNCTVLRNYAFVSMENEEEAQSAMDSLKDQVWRGKTLSVQLSHSTVRSNSSDHSPEQHQQSYHKRSSYYDTMSYCSSYHSGYESKRKKTQSQSIKSDYFPSQEAITYVKEAILNDPVARLMLMYDLIATLNESASRSTPSPPPPMSTSPITSFTNSNHPFLFPSGNFISHPAVGPMSSEFPASKRINNAISEQSEPINPHSHHHHHHVVHSNRG